MAFYTYYSECDTILTTTSETMAGIDTTTESADTATETHRIAKHTLVILVAMVHELFLLHIVFACDIFCYVLMVINDNETGSLFVAVIAVYHLVVTQKNRIGC